MGILDTVNARLTVKKQQAEVNKLSPLERVSKAISNDIATSNICLVQKDWAKWNADNGKPTSGNHKELQGYHEKMRNKLENHSKVISSKGGDGNALMKASRAHTDAAMAHDTANETPSKENSERANAASDKASELHYNAHFKINKAVCPTCKGSGKVKMGHVDCPACGGKKDDKDDKKEVAKSEKHPGFAKESAKIADKEGLSEESADAILASAGRNASAAAKKKNPALSKINKGWAIENQLRNPDPDSNAGWKKQQAAQAAAKPKKPYLG